MIQFMSESTFEHINDVPPARMRRLSQSQVERLLTPKREPKTGTTKPAATQQSTVTASGLLWLLDLGVYTLPGGGLVIGYGEDSQVHDHDRWLFHSKSPSGRWEVVDPEDRKSLRAIPGFANYLDETAAMRAKSQFGDFLALQSLVTCVSLETKRLQAQYGLDVKERDVLLAARTAGALTPEFLRQRSQMSYKDLHDMVYHPAVFAMNHPGLGVMPPIYLRALYGLAF